MVDTDEKTTLRHYLQRSREAVLWKLDGLSDYDVRRPMTPTGTNLLGLVKHLACCEFGYLGDTFDRPHGEALPWGEDDEDNADMWATAQESCADVVALYHRAWAHSDATIEALPLDGPGEVAWWPADRRGVTLHRVLVHLIDETSRHAGHADIVRESIDRAAGLRQSGSNLPDHDARWWAAYVQRLDRTAREATGGRGRSGSG